MRIENQLALDQKVALRCVCEVSTSGLLQHPGDIVKPGMTRLSTKMADKHLAEAADSSSAKAASSEGVDVEVSAHLTVIFLTCTTLCPILMAHTVNSQ